ncbi:MAG TPA: serine hydrolase [Streptosporangiaceae bacterium]|jgi:D-alanyl-D-alanine carboxypeptidase (penicillin-binding protein 5/6)
MRTAIRFALVALAGCAVLTAATAEPIAAEAATTARAASSSSAAAAVTTGPTGVVAAAADLVNVKTNRRLWSRRLDAELPMASITKIMTAIVVLNAHTLDRKIKVTAAAETYAEEHSAGSADLDPGDVLTTRQLLEALLLPSGADSAYLLANAYGPGWRAFVRKMNATARRLGMTHTHFANFDGLPWPTEISTYSSPRDLVVLGEAAMKLPTLRAIVSQRSDVIAATAQHHRYAWQNTNLLIGSYHGAIGIKTGFTLAAGYCVLFAAIRGGRELMGVVLDSTATSPSSRFIAARRLLNWGFAH